jgi:hypothetical protein
MSLRPDRQTQEVNIDFPCPWTQERGGALTWVQASGMYFVQYTFDPSGVHFAGLQLNDVENVNMTRQPFQQYLRDIDIPFAIVGAASQGDFVTDWIYPIGTINQGDLAYVGPSGMITNSSSFGGEIVGKFLGVLVPDPHLVTLRGFGFSRQYIDTTKPSKPLIWENNPADRLLLATPGYIKVRIDMGASLR